VDFLFLELDIYLHSESSQQFPHIIYLTSNAQITYHVKKSQIFDQPKKLIYQRLSINNSLISATLVKASQSLSSCWVWKMYILC